MTDLPVEKLFGVGKVTAGKLHGFGVQTCGDLQRVGQAELAKTFGKQGLRLWDMAHGRDERQVVVTRVAKSVSVERTFSHDLPGKAACQQVMAGLVDDLHRRLERKSGHKPLHKLFVKIRYSDFSTHTLERVRVTDEQRPVRLLGVGVRFREDGAPVTQLRLFE